MDIIELHEQVHARIIKAGATERTTDAVMWIVRAALRTKDVRITELEGENELLQRQLDTAEGKRPGTWDTWDEHAARKQATPPEPPPKPALSLEEARKQAAEYATRTRGGKQ